MTLGAWIFLSVVLILAVLNRPFRRLFFWVAAVSTVCCGLFFGYIWLRDWRERTAMARETVREQKKQDDCNARLNAPNSRESMVDAFQRLANADLCRANPDITPEQALLRKPDDTLGKVVSPPPGDTVEKPRAPTDKAPLKTLGGIITNNAIIYGQSLPGGPGGKVLGKVEKGTNVGVIRLDSIYGNVQIRTPNGTTGWISTGDIDY